MPGNNYYRLWQTDYDRKRTQIGLLTLRFPISKGQLRVQPLTSGGSIEVVYESNRPVKSANLRLFDIQGRQVGLWPATDRGSCMSMTLDVGFLPAGSYVLQLRDGRRTLQRRLILH